MNDGTLVEKGDVWNVTVIGIGFRNRNKGTELFINSLVSSIRPFSVGGYHHALGGSYSKEWSKANQLMGIGEVDYGFLNKDVTGNGLLSYLYKPKKFGRIYFKGFSVLLDCQLKFLLRIIKESKVGI